MHSICCVLIALLLGSTPVGVYPNQKPPGQIAQLSGVKDSFYIKDTNGTIYLDAQDVLGARVRWVKQQQCYAVELFFTADGREKFADATESVLSRSGSVENRLCFMLDNTMIANPPVYAPIDSDSILITEDFTLQEAQQLVDILSAP